MDRRAAAEQALAECFWGDYDLDVDTIFDRIDSDDRYFQRFLFSKLVENADHPSRIIRSLFESKTIERLLRETATAAGRSERRYRLVRANLTGELDLVPEYRWRSRGY